MLNSKRQENKFSGFFPGNRKAQMGEAMTWIVATLIIIVLLSISIYAATLLAETSLNYDMDTSRTQDVVMEKSLFAYFLVNNPNIKAQIKEDLSNMDFYNDFDEKFEELEDNI